jgi:hypothetical protein
MAVQTASNDISPNAVREHIRNLAQAYESLRLSMSPGHDRTNSLEQVASQMRSLGLTVLPFLAELKGSTSAGERLAAVTALEITPRIDSLDWLADRIIEERPFIGYHAALALRAAVRAFPSSSPVSTAPANADTDSPQTKICQAIAKAMKYLDDNELHHTDRYDVLAAVKSEGKCQ